MNNTHLIFMLFCFKGCFSDYGGVGRSANIEFSKKNDFFIEEYIIQNKNEDEFSEQLIRVWLEHQFHLVRIKDPGLFGEIYRPERFTGKFRGLQFVFQFEYSHFLVKNQHNLCLRDKSCSFLKKGNYTIDIADTSELNSLDTLILEYCKDLYCNELMLIKQKNNN